MRLLRHQRGLVEAGEDELQLAGVGVDVADGKDALLARLELLGIDRDEVFGKRDPPVGDGAELHRQPEEGEHHLDRQALLAVLGLDRRRFEATALAVHRRHLADHEADLLLGREQTHLLHRMRRTAELVAPVQEREALRYRLQIERPVERGIAAADDEHALAPEALHAADRIEHRGALIGLDAGKRRPLGRERAAARRDDDDLGDELVAGVGLEPKAAVGKLLQLLDLLAEVKLRIERLDLLQQPVGDLLPGDNRQPGNVVDRLVGIELPALAAGLVEDVDEVRLDVDEPQLEHGKEADGAGADDDGIRLDRAAGLWGLRLYVHGSALPWAARI